MFVAHTLRRYIYVLILRAGATLSNINDEKLRSALAEETGIVRTSLQNVIRSGKAAFVECKHLSTSSGYGKFFTLSFSIFLTTST